MSPELKDLSSQPLDSAPPKAGRARVKARHLSPLLQTVIVDSFQAKRSSEDVADELRIPARTIADVVLLEVLRQLRKPPASAGRSLALRGIA
jgi:hypothetical protein